MTVNHDAVAAFPISTAASQTAARNVLVKRMPYALADDDSAADLVAVDPNTGAVIEDILFLGRVFHFDATDTTTAADGTTCLVSSEGNRYKLAVGTDVVAWAVLDILTTPPDSPSIGDAYLVDAAATGAWSGKDDDVAIYTARGWEFVVFGVGRLLYVEDEDAYYHRKSDGSWVSGVGSLVVAANTVKASVLIGKPVRWIVENQTTNTPPSSPSLGDAYIIGSSPTGVWAADTGQIAVWEGAAWGIYAPRAGELAYDKSLKIDYRYDSDVPAWLSAAGAIVGSASVFTADGSSTTTGGSGAWTPGVAATAPTSSMSYVEDSATLTYTAKKSGAVLEFIYSYMQNDSNNSNVVISLFRDSEANAIARFRPAASGGRGNTVIFQIAANDTNSHTYKIRGIGAGDGGWAAPYRRLFTLKEYA